MRTALRMYRGSKHPHEPLRIRIRQRAKQIGVEHAEHRRVSPDAESQRERGHYGEASVFEQHSQTDAQVLKHFALQYLLVLMTPAGRSERLARERSSEKHCWLVTESEVWFHRKRRLRKVFYRISSSWLWPRASS